MPVMGMNASFIFALTPFVADELYQAEGVNPSVFSYIVGDVTIELARMLDLAQAHQVLIGEFHCQQAGWGGNAVKSITSVSAAAFAPLSRASLAAFSSASS